MHKIHWNWFISIIHTFTFTIKIDLEKLFNYYISSVAATQMKIELFVIFFPICCIQLD